MVHGYYFFHNRKCFGVYDTFEKKRIKLESTFETAISKLSLCGRKRSSDSVEHIPTPQLRRVRRRITNPSSTSDEAISPPVMVSYL